jgi:hypothetical protein
VQVRNLELNAHSETRVEFRGNTGLAGYPSSVGVNGDFLGQFVADPRTVFGPP